MLLVDRLLIGGIKFVLEKIVAAVDEQMNDESHLREELLAAQMKLELGEITDDEFRVIESFVLERMREIRERRGGGQPLSPTEMKIAGVEATFVGDEYEPEDEPE
jgi:hypothetical protein